MGLYVVESADGVMEMEMEMVARSEGGWWCVWRRSGLGRRGGGE